tara:strand:+ start:18535 stop:19053 length:519 start_codon:yes stop_codon:yes gene_type:complete
MVWKIDDISLPMDPTLVERRIIRNAPTQPTQFDFPSMGVTSLQSFTLKIKGFIWDEVLAQQLWELTKDAESEIINIQITDDTDHEWIAGTYAAAKSFIKRSGPQYVEETDGTNSPVWEYDIAFVQFAEAGIDGPGEELFPEDEDPGIGPDKWNDTLDDWVFDSWTWFAQILI